MKYKLIHFQTKEEHLCDKITIDGFDYYVSDDKILNGDYCVHPTTLNISQHSFDNNLRLYWKKIIATNNFSVNVPKVVHEINEVALQAYPIYPFYDGDELCDTDTNSELRKGFISGYNKSQETHSFSKDDMVEFAVFYQKHQGRSLEYWGKDLFKIWKEQKPKIVYYE
jgi:hypothetical protein